MNYQYRNPIYTDDGKIDCEVYLEEHGGWNPFTADPNDTDQNGRDTFAKILAGGNVAAYVPPPPPTEEQLAQSVRDERDALLQETDWTQLLDVPQETKDLWAPYRQALRDITEQEGFPADVTWPAPPMGD